MANPASLLFRITSRDVLFSIILSRIFSLLILSNHYFYSFLSIYMSYEPRFYFFALFPRFHSSITHTHTTSQHKWSLYFHVAPKSGLYDQNKRRKKRCLQNVVLQMNASRTVDNATTSASDTRLSSVCLERNFLDTMKRISNRFIVSGNEPETKRTLLKKAARSAQLPTRIVAQRI